MLHIADCLGERNSQGEFKPEKEEETRFSEGKKHNQQQAVRETWKAKF